MIQAEDILGNVKTWNIFAFLLSDIKKDVGNSIRVLEKIKIKTVLWFSLTQKTKTTALSIMQKLCKISWQAPSPARKATYRKPGWLQPSAFCQAKLRKREPKVVNA